MRPRGGHNGVRVHLIDADAPTPLVMFTVRQLEASYGLTVTASHNPALYNGIKVFTSGGRDADVATTELVQTRANQVDAADIRDMRGADAVAQGLIHITKSFNDYIDSVLSAIDVPAIRDAGLRVVLDPMFGVAQTCLQTVLVTARCQLDVIHGRHDTLFGGRLPSPNVTTLRALRREVTEGGYDLGIATDGDADRIGIIDNAGRFLHPNQLLVLLYDYLLRTKGWSGPVVRNLATTHMLDRIATAHGEECIEVPVGFKHVSSAMAESGAIIGGESSGGLTVRGHIPGKDGIYAAALLVEMVAKSPVSLAQHYAELEERYGRLRMVEADFSFAPERKPELLRLLSDSEQLPDYVRQISKVTFMDGLKATYDDDSWLVARFSGTEPLLRVFSEAGSEEAASDNIERTARWLGLA